MNVGTPIHIVLIFAGTVLLQLIAFQSGVRLGRWRSQLPDPEPQLPVRTMVASILSLLAFLMSFTFGLAASHFDSRGQSVFDEGVAISSAYRRADLLAEPDRTNVRYLLREYLDLRLEATESVAPDATLARIRQLQNQIWDEAVIIGKQSPGNSLLVQLLSDVINVHAERVLEGMRSRIPDKVWIILYCIMALSLSAAGYHSGLAGARRSVAALFYAFIFAAVVVLIAAGDNPGVDQFRSSHQTLMELRTRFGGE